MESYFFVPASKISKIHKINDLHANHLIIDFEDAIKASERRFHFKELLSLKASKDYFIRVPLHDLKKQDELNLDFLNKFLRYGYKRFIFPKVISLNQLQELFDSIDNILELDIILLIETPRIYLEILSNFASLSKYLYGIGLGSHDFLSLVGAQHCLKNLEGLRQNILYLSKSLNLISIDIASMEIEKDEDFVNEVIDGFNKGYEAKFIIHPKQLELLNSIQFYDEIEYNKALKIVNKLSKLKNNKEFSPIVIEGKIIEQPHINMANRVIKSYKK